MSSKDKSITNTLKEMFKRNRGNTGSYTSRSDIIYLSDDLLKDLSKTSPLSTRLRIMRDLGSRIVDGKLENHGVEKLWVCVEDLLHRDNTAETRHQAFQFLQCLIKGRNDKLGLMRAQFFRFIKNHDHPDDVAQRLELLITLTNNGKELLHFEEEVGPFLLNWINDVARAGKLEEYLSMIDILIKFNAAYMVDEVITGFIQHICVLCCSNGNSKIVLSCLEIMSSIVAYGNMLPESLPKFVGALCRTVNIEEYCAASWKIMKNLLGTHMGHSALFTMCRILQEPTLRSDTGLLRGAVFYIHMALWSSTPLANLHFPPSSVLPSYLQATKCNQASVAYEVVFGIQQLVHRLGPELQDPAWSILLQIFTYIICQIDLSSNQTPNKLTLTSLHQTLNNIEHLMEIGAYNGCVKQFFSVIEECSSQRPENSLLRLISFLSQSIVPTEYLWLTNLYNLLQKYLKPDVKTNIQLKVLDILSNVVKLNRRLYEEELIDRIVIPHMTNTIQSNDVIVRSSVANLLIDLCMDCESKKCLELLDILEKLLFRPFDTNYSLNDTVNVTHHQTVTNNESKYSDIVCLVNGLIKVFTHKIHKLPSWQAIKIYKMLVRFLEMHYTTPKVFEAYPNIRRMIFDCFLTMRADSHYHLGCPYNGKMRFSSYLCVTYDQKNIDKASGTGSGAGSGGPLSSPPSAQSLPSQPQSPGPVQHTSCTVTYVSLRRIFKVFITCLNHEKDWEVLNLVLRGTTKVLQNKSLILSKQGNSDLDLLVDVLCAMITDKSMNLPESLNVKVTKPDFHALVVSVLVNLASYHNYLDQIHQQKMIRCLVKCANTTGPKSPKHCIAALSICTLEMRDAMVKLLPEVLLNLSKISATVQISIPVLEFLSTLTQLPMVFGSFVADQYMAVFAISLPYTNPFRYNHYTVSLAHHVIAVWFLKCRVPFRKDFVKFITNGLQTNVLVPFEETKTIFNQNLSELNQDSSDRKRSSSLTEQGSRRRASTISSMRMDKPAPSSQPHQRPTPDKSVTIFYEELTETCIDLMARYAFSPCSALPRRLPAAEFFLKGGQSMCWMVGNKLVTVTTSGCSQKILKNGLCDKCWTLCNTQNEGRQSKRGSNDTEEIVGWASRQNSNEKSNNASLSSPSDEGRKISDKLEMLNNKLQNIASVPLEEKDSCACWCSGWAEIYVRRPTGDMSWVMRIQNQITFTHSIYEFPLNEISTLFMPSLYPKSSRGKARPPLRRQSSEDGVFNAAADEDRQAAGGTSSLTASNNSLPGSPRQSPSRQNSKDDQLLIDEHLVDDNVYYYDDDGTKSRNPVRRSNSSPEMSSSWKNPFLHHHHHQKIVIDSGVGGGEEGVNSVFDEDNNKSKNKMYSKDMRVSCEAIPEEIAGSGTTPPSSTPLQSSSMVVSTTTTFTPSHHPSLLSCHSYPGSSPPKENITVQKPYQTVPPSPNTKPIKAPEFPSRNTATTSRPMTLPEAVVRPPHSPTTQMRPMRQLSTTMMPREKEIHEIQKSSSSSIIEKNSSNMNLNLAREKAKERKNSGSMERLTSDNNQAQKRDRLHTISVMSPATRKPRAENSRQSARSKEVPKSGINPSFVFLQLYHAAYFGNKSERPIVVENTDVVMRAMKVLDSIAPYETHKIGLVYVRDGQNNNEAEIYKNKFGSLRYVEFLQNIGTMVKLADVDPQVFFLGGLDQHGNDGKFAYIWQDDVIRVMFHVATMMPNKESDPNCNNKKLHIANDYVTIVYHESEEDFNISTIKGQFTFACVIIQPLDHGINRVTVKVKEELVDLLPSSEPKLVSDQNVAILARQLALHANLASLVKRSLNTNHGDPYASNWLERLRRIKQVRNKVLQEQKHEDNVYQIDDTTGRNKKQMEDFTDYT